MSIRCKNIKIMYLVKKYKLFVVTFLDIIIKLNC